MSNANEQIAEKCSKMGGSGVERKKLWYVGRQGGAVLEEGRETDVRILFSLRLGVPIAVYLRGIWNWY